MPPIGLTLATIAADDATSCQRIGELAHFLGREAVIAPSATGLGDVVAVFLDRLTIDSRVDEIAHELWAVEDDAELTLASGSDAQDDPFSASATHR